MAAAASLVLNEIAAPDAPPGVAAARPAASPPDDPATPRRQAETLRADPAGPAPETPAPAGNEPGETTAAPRLERQAASQPLPAPQPGPAQQPAAQGIAGIASAPSATAAPETPVAQVTPPRPAPATPAQQVMPVLVTLAGGTGAAPRTVTVTLDPAELGRVAISVRREAEARATVQVVAERPETLLLLLRDQGALDRALAQAGVGPEGRTLSFDLAPNDQNPRDRQAREDRHSGRRGAVREPERPIAAQPAGRAQRTAHGGIDIAV